MLSSFLLRSRASTRFVSSLVAFLTYPYANILDPYQVLEEDTSVNRLVRLRAVRRRRPLRHFCCLGRFNIAMEIRRIKSASQEHRDSSLLE